MAASATKKMLSESELMLKAGDMAFPLLKEIVQTLRKNGDEVLKQLNDQSKAVKDIAEPQLQSYIESMSTASVKLENTVVEARELMRASLNFINLKAELLQEAQVNPEAKDEIVQVLFEIIRDEMHEQGEKLQTLSKRVEECQDLFRIARNTAESQMQKVQNAIESNDKDLKDGINRTRTQNYGGWALFGLLGGPLGLAISYGVTAIVTEVQIGELRDNLKKVHRDFENLIERLKQLRDASQKLGDYATQKYQQIKETKTQLGSLETKANRAAKPSKFLTGFFLDSTLKEMQKTAALLEQMIQKF